MGTSFSVPEGVRVPPSLKNIYKELEDEGYEGYGKRKSGDLTFWVDRGVFLYNACLTVNAGESGSHKDLWIEFSDLVINYLKRQEHIAWIFLGQKAKRFAKCLDRDKHGIFETSHPSPYSADRGFFGSGIFEEAEDYLVEHGRKFTWALDYVATTQ